MNTNNDDPEILFPTSRNYLEDAQSGKFGGTGSRALSNTNSFVSEGGFSSMENTLNNQNQAGNVSIVNNVKVSDNREIWKMIEQNNQKGFNLTENNVELKLKFIC
jgi:hypothetical protein